LISYLASDDGDRGVYVAIRYRDAKSSEMRMKELPARVTGLASRTAKQLAFAAIDARRKVSASKIYY
jgi:hypothetical protein